MGSIGNSNTTSSEPTNYLGETESQWNERNARVEQDFYNWLGSKEKKAFEADQYNVFEKMTLDEVKRWMTPESESFSRSYYSGDEVPEDDSWAILYKDGTVTTLGEGDSLKGVKRSNIEAAIYSNASTIVLYGKPGNFEFYQSSKWSDGNDIWGVDFTDKKRRK